MVDKDKVLHGVQMLLDGLGVDLQNKHFQNTPERAANAWVDEICSGLGEKKFSLTTFPAGENFQASAGSGRVDQRYCQLSMRKPCSSRCGSDHQGNSFMHGHARGRP